MFKSGFAALWGAYTISIIGDWAYRIAMPLVVYDLTQSPFLMSLAYAATFAPFIVVMPFGGVLADAMDRKKILWVSDLLSAVVAIAICAYLAFGGANVYFMLPGLAVLGALASVSHPAFQGFIPSIVRKEDLSRANSLVTTSDSLLNLIAPAVSGVLIGFLGAYWVLWLNAVSFVLSAGLVLTIRHQSIPDMATSRILSLGSVCIGLKEGFETAMRYPLIKWGTLLFILVNFSSHIILGNLIYFLTQNLGLDASLAGLAIGLSAAGAVPGALIAPQLMQRWHPGHLMLGCVAVSAVGTAILLIGSEFGFWAVVVGRAITSGAEAIIVVTMFTERQRQVPQQYLSRTVAITRTISYLPVPIAAITGGILLSAFGGDMTGVIVISAVVLVLCVVLGLFTPFVGKQARAPESVTMDNQTSHGV